MNAPKEYIRSKHLWATLTAVVSGSICLLFLPGTLAAILIKENGLIEIAQCTGYAAGALISWSYAKRGIWKGGLNGGTVLLLLALRELDFQRSFTGISITRTKFYFSAQVPILIKVIGGCIALSMLSALMLLIARNTRSLVQGMRERKEWAFSAASGVILLPVALILDASLRFLEFFGIRASKEAHLAKTVFEEMTELAIPSLFLIALIQYGVSASKKARKHSLR